ncbi:hypothetical protein BJ322DRAFT_1072649 [Thelephora terrestris]|uniref:Uncharacterized protein n=1 Tax=Thelephora terrestris TaxID=56493 RepID=A0A9P6HAK1_9AGAM|nr:hypothetical protein BJ322DRAFT_1072649 [Thelephora terrestris]
MAYFNNNASFYPEFLSAEGFDYIYSSVSKASTAEEVHDALITHWSEPGQPDPVVGSSASLPTPANHEYMAPGSSWMPQADWYSRPSFADHDWRMPETQPELPGFLSSSSSLANALGTEVPTVMPAPGSFPLGYWGNIQGGPSTSTFDPLNMYTTYQLSTGPTRTEQTQATRRFQPYGTSRTRTIEYANAEAGPSTLAPPPVPYVGPPAPEPSGGLLSETSADAEQTQTILEEDEVPRQVTQRTGVPTTGEAKPRRYRVQAKGPTSSLLEWAKTQMAREELPSFNEALAAAVEAIQTIRPALNQEPYLAKTALKREQPLSTKAEKERGRRTVERGLYKELSRMYPRGPKPWLRHELLARVVQDLPTHQDPPMTTP